MKRFIAWTTLTTALIPLVAVTGDAGELVEIRLRGRFYAEPATVQITVAVEPGESHRMLRIAADGDAYYRASEVALEGKNDKRLHTVEFRSLPAGAYVLVAELHSSDALLGKATQELVVTSSGR